VREDRGIETRDDANPAFGKTKAFRASAWIALALEWILGGLAAG